MPTKKTRIRTLPLPSVLIVGASRGIGLELARQHLQDGCQVTATVRRKSDARKLGALGAKVILFDAVKSPTAAVARAAGAADIVIYNAGVYGDGNRVSVVQKKTNFDKVMQANVFGALRLTAAVAARLSKRKGKLVFISSRMGSIGLMTNGNGVVYRASKAAVNAVARSAALDFGPRGLTVLTMHPGWVRTGMGGRNAEIDVAASVSGIRATIAKATPRNNGQFLDYTGHKLAW
jgi:NAD(P)-dependent dehydrogenase (short-subunit alcohol dehydrogenase family)